MNRRFFLRGAAVATPMLAVPAVAAAASSYAEENPVLLEIGERLDVAEAAMISATAYRADAFEIGSRLWPRAPDELRTRYYDRTDSDYERAIDGRAYDAPEIDPERRCVLSLEFVRTRTASVARSRGPGSKARKVAAARSLGLAEQYAAQKEHVLRVSGFKDADRALEDAVAAVERLNHEAHAAEAFTMAGVEIKARAIRAWGRAPKWHRSLVALKGGEAWAPGLAASLLAVMGGAQ